MITRERFIEILDGFPHVQVAIFGDFFLDKYLVIDPALNEPSLETGLDAFQVVSVRHSPGAAGTVAANLAALQVGALYAIGAIGDDGHGYELRQGLQWLGVDMSHLLVLDEIVTPTYTKPMIIQPDGSEKESNRLDIKNRRPFSEATQQRLIRELEAVLPDVQAVIIADQIAEAELGVITPWVREQLAMLARTHPDKIFFADSRAHIGEFRNLIIKPNAREAALAFGPLIFRRGVRRRTKEATEMTAAPADPSKSVPSSPEALDRQALARGGRALARRNGRPVFITLGADGMLVCRPRQATHVPGIRVEGPIDICGAGDSATAGIVAALGSGASYEEAALFGNVVASLTIQQIGTTGTASPSQVLQRFLDVYGS